MAIKEEIVRKRLEEQEELRKLKERRSQMANATVAEDSSPLPSPNSSPVKGDGFPTTLVRQRTTSKRRYSTGKRRNRSNSEESDSSTSESSELTLLELTSGKTTSNMFYKGEVLGECNIALN